MISASLSDMTGLSTQVDRDTIIQETVRQIRKSKGEREDHLPVQLGDVSSSKPAAMASSLIAPFLIEALDGFFFVVNNKESLVCVSESVQQYLGHQQSDLIGKSVYDLVHMTDHSLFRLKLLPLQDEQKAGGITTSTNQVFNCRFRTKLCGNPSAVSQQKKKNVEFEYMQVSAMEKPYPCEDIPTSPTEHQSCLVCVARRMSPASGCQVVPPSPTLTGVMTSPMNSTLMGRVPSSGMEQLVTKQNASGVIIWCDTSQVAEDHYRDDQFIGKYLKEFCHGNDVQLLTKHMQETVKSGRDTSSVYRFKLSDFRYSFVQSQSQRVEEAVDGERYIVSNHQVIRECNSEVLLKGKASSSLMKSIIQSNQTSTPAAAPLPAPTPHTPSFAPSLAPYPHPALQRQPHPPVAFTFDAKSTAGFDLSGARDSRELRPVDKHRLQQQQLHSRLSSYPMTMANSLAAAAPPPSVGHNTLWDPSLGNMFSPQAYSAGMMTTGVGASSDWYDQTSHTYQSMAAGVSSWRDQRKSVPHPQQLPGNLVPALSRSSSVGSSAPNHPSSLGSLAPPPASVNSLRLPLSSSVSSQPALSTATPGQQFRPSAGGSGPGKVSTAEQVSKNGFSAAQAGNQLANGMATTISVAGSSGGCGSTNQQQQSQQAARSSSTCSTAATSRVDSSGSTIAAIQQAPPLSINPPASLSSSTTNGGFGGGGGSVHQLLRVEGSTSGGPGGGRGSNTDDPILKELLDFDTGMAVGPPPGIQPSSSSALLSSQFHQKLQGPGTQGKGPALGTMLLDRSGATTTAEGAAVNEPVLLMKLLEDTHDGQKQNEAKKGLLERLLKDEDRAGSGRGGSPGINNGIASSGSMGTSGTTTKHRNKRGAGRGSSGAAAIAASLQAGPTPAYLANLWNHQTNSGVGVTSTAGSKRTASEAGLGESDRSGVILSQLLADQGRKTPGEAPTSGVVTKVPTDRLPRDIGRTMVDVNAKDELMYGNQVMNSSTVDNFARISRHYRPGAEGSQSNWVQPSAGSSTVDMTSNLRQPPGGAPPVSTQQKPLSETTGLFDMVDNSDSALIDSFFNSEPTQSRAQTQGRGNGRATDSLFFNEELDFNLDSAFGNGGVGPTSGSASLSSSGASKTGSIIDPKMMNQAQTDEQAISEIEESIKLIAQKHSSTMGAGRHVATGGVMTSGSSGGFGGTPGGYAQRRPSSGPSAMVPMTTVTASGSGQGQRGSLNGSSAVLGGNGGYRFDALNGSNGPPTQVITHGNPPRQQHNSQQSTNQRSVSLSDSMDGNGFPPPNQVAPPSMGAPKMATNQQRGGGSGLTNHGAPHFHPGMQRQLPGGGNGPLPPSNYMENFVDMMSSNVPPNVSLPRGGNNNMTFNPVSAGSAAGAGPQQQNPLQQNQLQSQGMMGQQNVMGPSGQKQVGQYMRQGSIPMSPALPPISPNLGGPMGPLGGTDRAAVAGNPFFSPQPLPGGPTNIWPAQSGPIPSSAGGRRPSRATPNLQQQLGGQNQPQGGSASGMIDTVMGASMSKMGQAQAQQQVGTMRGNASMMRSASVGGVGAASHHPAGSLQAHQSMYGGSMDASLSMGGGGMGGHQAQPAQRGPTPSPGSAMLGQGQPDMMGHNGVPPQMSPNNSQGVLSGNSNTMPTSSTNLAAPPLSSSQYVKKHLRNVCNARVQNQQQLQQSGGLVSEPSDVGSTGLTGMGPLTGAMQDPAASATEMDMLDQLSNELRSDPQMHQIQRQQSQYGQPQPGIMGGQLPQQGMHHSQHQMAAQQMGQQQISQQHMGMQQHLPAQQQHMAMSQHGMQAQRPGMQYSHMQPQQHTMQQQQQMRLQHQQQLQQQHHLQQQQQQQQMHQQQIQQQQQQQFHQLQGRMQPHHQQQQQRATPALPQQQGSMNDMSMGMVGSSMPQQPVGMMPSSMSLSVANPMDQGSMGGVTSSGIGSGGFSGASTASSTMSLGGVGGAQSGGFDSQARERKVKEEALWTTTQLKKMAGSKSGGEGLFRSQLCQQGPTAPLPRGEMVPSGDQGGAGQSRNPLGLPAHVNIVNTENRAHVEDMQPQNTKDSLLQQLLADK